MAAPKRIMVLGHSHVRRLNDVIHSDFGVNPQQAVIRFYGQGGLRIPGLFSNNIINMLRNFQPEFLILMIGDNDIAPSVRTSHDVAAHNIVDNLFNAILTLQSTVSSIQQVFLCQLLPCHPGAYFRPGYNDIALKINNILLQSAVAAEQSLLRVFRFRDFCFPQESELKRQRYLRNRRLFRSDGTHLTTYGYRRLRRAMRAVVFACISPN